MPPSRQRRDFRRADIGYLLLGISLVLLLLAIRKKKKASEFLPESSRRKAPRRPLCFSPGFAVWPEKRTKFFFFPLRGNFFPDLRFFMGEGLRSPLCPPEVARRGMSRPYHCGNREGDIIGCFPDGAFQGKT